MIHKAQIINRNNHFLGQDVLDEENEILKRTGFTGSSGMLIVAENKSYLLVDGRYEIQAKKQTTIETVCPKYGINTNWILDNFAPDAEVEYNPWTISAKEIKDYKHLFPKMTFIAKPELKPTAKASTFEHELKYTGKSFAEKIKEFTDIIKLTGIDAYIITAADSVSWLTNLRSNALPHSPIIRAFAIVTVGGTVTLFADNLEHKGFDIRPLSEIETELKKHKSLGWQDNATPAAIVDMLDKHHIKHKNLINPCVSIKSLKNPTEINGFIHAHTRDGVAVCSFLCWLENNWKGKTELDIVKKLQEFRKQQKDYYSDSFSTIAATDANAAIVHYRPEPATNQKLGKLLLLDSGAQYFDGTTDATRTIALQKPSKEAIEKFTTVLKAHIALASAKFPRKVKGIQLDTICRSQMWKQGLDYAHGTGHGVGHFLNVHEGPQSMNTTNTAPILENMVLSIEPGYYEENKFGIRIENLAYVPEIEDKLCFSILTLVPIDKTLINAKLLDKEEINWLNHYHKTVFAHLFKHLGKKEREWLKNACAPLVSKAEKCKT